MSPLHPCVSPTFLPKSGFSHSFFLHSFLAEPGQDSNLECSYRLWGKGSDENKNPS